MKFNYKLPTFAKISIAIACSTTLATAAYYILKCFGVWGLPQGSIAVNVSGAVVCLILFVLAVSLCAIRYKICGEYLCQKYLFFDLLAKRVKTKNILNIVYKKDVDKLYFSYLTDAPDPIIVLVSINKSKVKDFVLAVKNANPNVIYFEED